MDHDFGGLLPACSSPLVHLVGGVIRALPVQGRGGCGSEASSQPYGGVLGFYYYIFMLHVYSRVFKSVQLAD